MSVKEQIFTLVDEKVGAIICLYDEQSKNGLDVIEAINHLVDGAFEERILKKKNQSLIKDDASHFFFSQSYGQQLNILYGQLPKIPSKNEMNQFISIIDKQYDIDTEYKILVIKPSGNSFKFHHPSLEIKHFDY